MKKFEKIFKSLANEKRLKILKFLTKNKAASVGEIADEIRTSVKSTSKHLLLLYHAGFLEKERVSSLTVYSIHGSMEDFEKKIFALLKNKF